MDELSIRRAKKYMDSGLELVARGLLKEARERFKSSAGSHVTSDALTYWGWMEHRLGNTALAIMLCHRAIKVDPDFGNPYNDIGSYLISLGKPDQAIPWLEKAVSAKRYEPRQFPHLNLGRIYLAKGHLLRAAKEFTAALQHCPHDLEILRLLSSIQTSIH